MKAQNQLKVPVRRGREVVVGVLTPPVVIKGRTSKWTGAIAGSEAAVTGDTAEECADNLRDVTAS